MDSRLKAYFSPIINWIYLLLICVFFIHKVTEVQGWSHWMLRSYLDDFLLAPIVLPVVLVLLRLIFKKLLVECYTTVC